MFNYKLCCGSGSARICIKTEKLDPDPPYSQKPGALEAHNGAIEAHPGAVELSMESLRRRKFLHKEQFLRKTDCVAQTEVQDQYRNFFLLAGVVRKSQTFKLLYRKNFTNIILEFRLLK